MANRTSLYTSSLMAKKEKKKEKKKNKKEKKLIWYLKLKAVYVLFLIPVKIFFYYLNYEFGVIFVLLKTYIFFSNGLGHSSGG